MSTAIGGRCPNCGRVVVHGHERRCLAMAGLPRGDVDAVEGFAAKIAHDAEAHREAVETLCGAALEYLRVIDAYAGDDYLRTERRRARMRLEDAIAALKGGSR